jgi:glycosyltransferase involved in cell wall biosynthesis
LTDPTARATTRAVLLSVVIPVYNEERTVAALIEKVRAVDLEKEIIIVDDGSSDGTRQALAPYESMPGVRVHHSPVNLGKGASVRIGFSFARGDLVVIQDADLELNPENYHRLIRPLLDGEADVVYGSRFLGGGGRGGKLSFYLANRALAGLTNVLYGARLSDVETCYKVLRREVIPSLKLRAARFEIEPELTAQVLKRGLRLVEVPVDYTPRTHEEGKKISWKDGFTAVYTLIAQRLQ